MPVLDMPLEKLKKYMGSSPCPQDIDAYWDEGLRQMKQLDPEIEWVPAAFQTPAAECFDLYFTGMNNARIHCRFARPRNITGSIPAVLQFHGYSGNCGDWMGLVPYASNGFAIAAMDCRGQGGTSEDPGGVRGNTLHGHIIRGLDEPDPTRLYFRQVFLDCAQLAGIVMDLPYVDEKRVGVFGGSQGGALTMACISLEPRINRAAPQYPFLSDYYRVWDMDLDANAYSELREYFRRFDPRHEREDEIFLRLGYIDIQNIAHRIRAEVKMFTGLLDNICPPSTQFAAYNKIPGKKSMVLYPDFGHEGFPDYSDMVMQYMLQM